MLSTFPQSAQRVLSKAMLCQNHQDDAQTSQFTQQATSIHCHMMHNAAQHFQRVFVVLVHLKADCYACQSFPIPNLPSHASPKFAGAARCPKRLPVFGRSALIQVDAALRLHKHHLLSSIQLLRGLDGKSSWLLFYQNTECSSAPV